MALVGIYGAVSSNEPWEMTNISIGFGIVGIVSVVSSIIGMCSASGKSRGGSTAYGALMILLVIGMIVIGSLAIAAARDNVKILAFSLQLWEDLPDVLRNSIQKTYECCGYLNAMHMKGSQCPANLNSLRGCAGAAYDITEALVMASGILSVVMGVFGGVVAAFFLVNASNQSFKYQQPSAPNMSQI